MVECINLAKKKQRTSFTMHVRSHKVVFEGIINREKGLGSTLFSRGLARNSSSWKTTNWADDLYAGEIQFVVANANFTGQLHRCLYGPFVIQRFSETAADVRDITL